MLFQIPNHQCFTCGERFRARPELHANITRRHPTTSDQVLGRWCEVFHWQDRFSLLAIHVCWEHAGQSNQHCKWRRASRPAIQLPVWRVASPPSWPRLQVSLVASPTSWPRPGAQPQVSSAHSPPVSPPRSFLHYQPEVVRQHSKFSTSLRSPGGDGLSIWSGYSYLSTTPSGD